MTGVQLSGQTPGEEMNGLNAIAESFMRHGEEPVVAVVIVDTSKVVENRVNGETYPVVRFSRIEPVLAEADRKVAVELMKRAFDARENRPALDYGDEDDDDRGEGGDV